MKRKFINLIFIFIASNTKAQLLPNGDFENFSPNPFKFQSWLGATQGVGKVKMVTPGCGNSEKAVEIGGYTAQISTNCEGYNYCVVQPNGRPYGITGYYKSVGILDAKLECTLYNKGERIKVGTINKGFSWGDGNWNRFIFPIDYISKTENAVIFYMTISTTNGGLAIDSLSWLAEKPISAGSEFVDDNMRISLISENPSDGLYSFQVGSMLLGETYNIFSINGKLVSSGTFNDANVILDIKNNDAGLYYLKTESGYIKKLILQ